MWSNKEASATKAEASWENVLHHEAADAYPVPSG